MNYQLFKLDHHHKKDFVYC